MSGMAADPLRLFAFAAAASTRLASASASALGAVVVAVAAVRKLSFRIMSEAAASVAVLCNRPLMYVAAM